MDKKGLSENSGFRGLLCIQLISLALLLRNLQTHNDLCKCMLINKSHMLKIASAMPLKQREFNHNTVRDIDDICRAAVSIKISKLLVYYCNFDFSCPVLEKDNFINFFLYCIVLSY